MIKEVTDAVEARLRETLTEVGYAGEMPSFGFGARALVAEDSPPRITWVPVRGRHDKTRPSTSDGKITPKHIWTRHVIVEAHIWADDETAAEVLLGHLVASLQRYIGAGGYSMVGEEWAPSDVGSDGIKLVVGIEFRMPLTTEPLALVKPTSVALAGTVEGALS